jgi:protein AaeX
MFDEITISTFLVPGLLLVLMACFPLFIALDLTLARTGTYRHVWHPALFRASLFVSIFCLASWLTHLW